MSNLINHAMLLLAQVSPAAPAAAGGAAPAAAPDMGFMHFVAQSDAVGKGLFLILILMSLVSWYLIFVKAFNNMRVRRRSADFLNKFWNASSLEQVENEIATHGAGDPFSHLASHAMHARDHHSRYGATKLEETGSNGEFVQRTMRKVIDEETAKLENGLTVLASVGSTAPFVGLFGTVWGIMRSFTAIAAEQNSSLAVVAPGIAEALFATAIGLFAAIPAVIAYNRLTHRLNRLEAGLTRFADSFHATLSRALEK